MLSIDYIIKNTDKILESIKKKNIELNLYKLISFYKRQKDLKIRIDNLRQISNQTNKPIIVKGLKKPITGREEDFTEDNSKKVIKESKVNEKERQLNKKSNQGKSENNIIKEKELENYNNLLPQFPTERKNEIYKIENDWQNIVKKMESEYKAINKEYKNMMLKVPNILLKEVPIGKTDKDNLEWKKWGKIRKFNFKAKSHIELGKDLDIIDFESAVNLSSTKQYILKGLGTMLELAVLDFALKSLIEKGFKPYTVPLMVKHKALEGTGYFPGNEEQTYYLEKEDLYLVGTSEVSLCSMYENSKLNLSDLPIKMLSLSNCFRREAGSYGKDTQGLYRIHQFQKVEQVVISFNDAKESERLHFELLSNSEEIIQKLNLPYRVVRVCSGDLGMGQVIKHDIETWMPSRNNYGETHSCSSFYDFQARRLNIKYKDNDNNTYYAYTLNNTAIASPRILIAIMENYQNEDGSITVPEVLRPFMNNIKFIR